MKALLWFALAALVAAPSAYAAEIEAVISTNHPPEHKVLVPETRRTNEPLHVALKIRDMVCVTEAEWSVHATITYDGEWAGVSLNPTSSKVKVPQGKPGTEALSYAGSDLSIDVYWGENRPKTDAEITYTITVEPDDITLGTGGPCLPDAGENVKGTIVQITFRGDDIIDPANLTGPNCAAVPDDPACLEPTTLTPMGESPGAEAVVMFAALGGALLLRRRRL